MFGNMMNPMMPQGFMYPGQGQPNMAPQMPQTGQRGAAIGAPNMPSAFGPAGQMNAQGGQPGQGGMFSQMMQNPQLMAMMKSMQGQGQGQPQGQTPQGAALGQSQPYSPGSSFNPEDIQRMSGMFDGQQPSASPGMWQQLIAGFGGGGGS